jgi:NAD(P)-dependent dehydrogenase (short-subunit alcohol dehydrogenase family)
MRFQDKVTIVTGASSGIGRDIAVLFSNEGSKVVVIARSEKGLDETISLFKNQDPNDHLKIVADLSDNISYQKIVNETIKKFGKINNLINNAGIGLKGNALEMTSEDYDKTMNINLKAVIFLTQKCIPHLIEQKGTITNISSVDATKNFSTYLAYTISKVGLDKFTTCTALELGSKGVRVNAVKPGWIKDTDIMKYSGLTKAEVDEYIAKDYLDSNPMKKEGTVDEISKTVAFLGN